MLDFNVLEFIKGIPDYLWEIDWSKLPFVDKDITFFDAIVAILGLFLAWRGVRLAKIALIRTIGNEKLIKQKLDIKFFGTPIEAEFVLFAPFETNRLAKTPNKTFAFPFPITVMNSADVSAMDVEVYAELNSTLYRGDQLTRLPKALAAARGMITAYEKRGEHQIVTVLWRIGHIPPNSSAEIQDIIFNSHPTYELKWTTPVTTSDGKDMVVKGDLSFSFDLKLMVTAKDFESTTTCTKLAFRESFSGELKDYITDRIDETGELNKLDAGRKTFVTFTAFEQPDFDVEHIANLRKSIVNRDEFYELEISKLVPSRFKTETKARKYLFRLLKRTTLEARNARVMIGGSLEP